MASPRYLFKRGKTYWWRRNVPKAKGAMSDKAIYVSLQTSDMVTAGRIATELKLVSDQLKRPLKQGSMTLEDAKEIITQHVVKCSSLPSVWETNPDYASLQERARRQASLLSTWALTYYARYGLRAAIGEEEIREMSRAGLDIDTIADVSRSLVIFLANRQGLHLTDAHRDRVSDGEMDSFPLSHRYRASAQEEGWLSFTAPGSLPPGEPSALRPAHDDDKDRQSPPPAFATKPAARLLDLPNDKGVTDDPDPAPQPVDHGEISPDIVALVTRAHKERGLQGDWGDKCGRQHVVLARLFAKFLGHQDPRRVQQQDIARFKSSFHLLPKNYGKSPGDAVAGFKTILSRAKALPPQQVGLSPSTINRHLTQLENIAQICRFAGYPFANYEGVGGLRVKRRGDPRFQRGKFSTQELETMFALPLWNGCKRLNQRLVEGSKVFHDAGYWVPILAIYLGARREEICGLRLDEINLEVEVPVITIRSNDIRSLKTIYSPRELPIHSELVRLGFGAYVETLRQMGHVLVFPELRSNRPETPLGNVYDHLWRKVRARSFPDAQRDKKVFHSLRHWCNNEMKQANVPVETRRDILGHAPEGLLEGRYAQASRPKLMCEALSLLPQPTSSLKPYPLLILESVATHRPPRTRPPRRGLSN